MKSGQKQSVWPGHQKTAEAISSVVSCMYNGQRPVGPMCYSVFGNLNSNKKMHFSHILLNRDELLQDFVDGDLSTLYFITNSL